MRLLLILPVLLWGAAAPAQQAATYAGQEGRAIASLSQGDVADLLAGRGFEFAKPAELNGYPGPAHILELADRLSLDDAQRAVVQRAFDRMQAAARTLGADYVEAEARLDAAFGPDVPDTDEVVQLVAEAGEQEAALRSVHLAAHLEVWPVLTGHQKRLYAEARGYGPAMGEDGGEHEH